MDILNVFLSILGIGFLIFVHELGHFLAAKKVGIRVETFALGFQPTIFGWKARLLAIQRGETEYVIGLLPFGGYVKMAGEELDDPRTGSSDEYASKNPSQRAFVLVAGAAMNLLFGFLLFMAAFSMGVKFPGTRIGQVVPGSPAWEAGLRPGDRITAVNGDPKRDFTDLRTSIALSSQDQDLEITYSRTDLSGEVTELKTELRPVMDRARGLLSIGIRPATGSVIATLPADQPAAKAGLRPGDKIEQFSLIWENERVDLPRHWVFDSVYETWQPFQETTADCEVGFTVARGDDGESSPEQIEVPIRAGEPFPPARLGISVQARRIVALQPGIPMEGALPLHTEVVAIDGNPISNFDLWAVLRNHPSPEGAVELQFSDGSRQEVDRGDLIDSLAGGSGVLVGGRSQVIRSLTPQGLATQIGLQVGDQILQIGESPLPTTSDTIEPGTVIVWERAGQENRTTTPSGPPSPLGAELGFPPVIGRVTSGGPADRTGLRSGDWITRIGDTPIVAWEDVPAAIQELQSGNSAEGPATPLSITVRREGEDQVYTVTPEPLLYRIGLPLPLDQFLLKTSLTGAVAEGWNQSIIWGKRIFLMLGALARRDVSPKNLAGPVGIVHIGQQVAREGFSKLLFVLAMISINLGVFNLLPFPILDGGHLAFLLVEKIKGTPVDDRVQNAVHLVAFLLLIGLALFVTYHDILRIGG